MEQQHVMNDPASYPGFYPPEQDPAYNISYATPQMSPYQVVHNGPQTRQHATQHVAQGMPIAELQQSPMPSYHNMPIMSHQYQGYPSSEAPHVLPTSPPPPSPDLYDPLSPPVSGSDTSADGIYHHHTSSNNSPSSSRANSLVHRSNIRYNPTPSPTSSSGRRSRGSRSQDSDDEDMGVLFAENLAHSRKEATRRQRIEAEQRRRDELRDGYAKLKDVLPVSNQKSSKVSLLDRATQYITSLEKTNQDLQARITQLEQEMQRLRSLNEKMSLGDTPSPGVFDARPLSPPPDVPIAAHTLNNVRAQDPSSGESSPSASDDNGY